MYAGRGGLSRKRETPPPTIPDDASHGAPPRRPRILLVEDSIANREVVSVFLDAAGYAVEVATDGPAALSALGAARYDAILMDVAMPGMDGWEVTRRLRAGDGPCAEAPVIALTAHTERDDQRACRDAGMNDFVAKPVERDALLPVVARWAGAGAAVETDGKTGRLRGRTAREPKALIDLEAIATVARHASAERLLDAAGHFDAETRARLGRIATALLAEDLGVLESECHALKSGAGALGLRRLEELARAVELASRNGNRARALRLAPALSELGERSLRRLREALSEV